MRRSLLILGVTSLVGVPLTLAALPQNVLPAPVSSSPLETSEASQTAQPVGKSLTNATVSSEQVSQMVRAMLAIQPLLEQTNKKLAAVNSDEQKLQIELQFEKQASAIVQKQGLSVEQYRQLMVLANGDNDFKQRVATRITELQGAKTAQPSPPQ
jgi:hypothetical protein